MSKCLAPTRATGWQTDCSLQSRSARCKSNRKIDWQASATPPPKTASKSCTTSNPNWRAAPSVNSPATKWKRTRSSVNSGPRSYHRVWLSASGPWSQSLCIRGRWVAVLPMNKLRISSIRANYWTSQLLNKTALTVIVLWLTDLCQCHRTLPGIWSRKRCRHRLVAALWNTHRCSRWHLTGQRQITAKCRGRLLTPVKTIGRTRTTLTLRSIFCRSVSRSLWRSHWRRLTRIMLSTTTAAISSIWLTRRRRVEVPCRNGRTTGWSRINWPRGSKSLKTVLLPTSPSFQSEWPLIFARSNPFELCL